MFKTNRLALGAILLGGLGAACGGKSAITPAGVAGSGGNAIGTAGQSGAAGTQPDASGAAGATGAAGGGGTITISDGGNDAANGADGGGSSGDAAGTDGAADSSGNDGDTAGADGGGTNILKVAPTMGCGHAPGQANSVAVMGTIDTMGTKAADCADSKCGPWMYTRQYVLTLPARYDNYRPFPLVLEPVSCGGTGANNLPLTFNGNPNVDDTVIRVGLTPPPNAIGHSTNPNQGCPDDAEGDDSVDWVFYENLYDRLAAQICFDRNRVFVVGVHHGGVSANELACKYAGDATRPIRAVLSDGGGLPNVPEHVPTCTNKPLAGMWVNGTGNALIPFTLDKVAIARAMKVNGCTIGTSFDDAVFDPFPIAADQSDDTCKMMRGCPDATPLVVCALKNNYVSTPSVSTPGFPTFIELFEKPPLLSP
jgi:hypothetical protein